MKEETTDAYESVCECEYVFACEKECVCVCVYEIGRESVYVVCVCGYEKVHMLRPNES